MSRRHDAPAHAIPSTPISDRTNQTMNTRSPVVSRAIMVAVAVQTVALLAACGTHANAPEPESDNNINGTNQHVIKMPAGFRNIAFTCWDHTGVYSTSRGSDSTVPSSVFVKENDEHCK
jgi:hypothetical protein